MDRTTQWHPKPGKKTRGARKYGNGGMLGSGMRPGRVSYSISQPPPLAAFMLGSFADSVKWLAISKPKASGGACYALRTPFRRGSKIRVRCAIARKKRLLRAMRRIRELYRRYVTPQFCAWFGLEYLP